MKLTKCTPCLGYRQGWFIQFPYDPDFLEVFKDAIEKRDRAWDDDKRQWWVRERCGETLRELFENWTHPVSQETPKPKCPICKGTGLLPFVNKESKTIPHAFLFCECSEYNHPEIDHFHPLVPSDIDYPVSYSHYRALCQYHGWPDPGDDSLIEQASTNESAAPREIIHRHFHQYEPKPKPKTKPPTYKGLPTS